MTKGNDKYDAQGMAVAGEKAARQQLANFVKFLEDVLAGRYIVGGNYKTTWEGISDYYMLQYPSSSSTKGKKILTPLAVDIIREFNNIFELLLKGVPGTEVTNVESLFDVHIGSQGEIYWGYRLRNKDMVVTGTARLVMMVHLGAVSFEYTKQFSPKYGLVLQSIIERLFSDPKENIRRELEILAECNGLGINYKKGLEEHDGFLYGEMYYLENPQYRVLFRVNLATISLVRDGIELFYFGTEAAPVRPSATMETLKRAIAQKSVSAFLAVCPQFRSRFIFDVLADAIDPLNYPT